MFRKLLLGLGVAIALAMIGSSATTASAKGYGTGQSMNSGHGGGYGNVYCMKYGDTIWGVAYRHGVSAHALASHNGIYNPNYVRAGTCLRIPAAKPMGYGSGYNAGQGTGHNAKANPGYGAGYSYGKKMGNRYCVRYGDTLYSIAHRYHTSAWAIANANGIKNPNWIQAGSCLTIPGH